MSYRSNLRPVVEDFTCRVNRKYPGGFNGVFLTLAAIQGILDDYSRWDAASLNSRTLDQQMCDEYDDAGPYVNTVIGLIPNPYHGCKGA